MDPKPTDSSIPAVNWESTETPIPTQMLKVKTDSENKTSQVAQDIPLHDGAQSAALKTRPTKSEEHPQAKKVARQVNKTLEQSTSNIPIAPKYQPKKTRYVDNASKYKYIVEREKSEALEDIGVLFVENTREKQLNHIDNQLKQRTLEKEFQLKVIETKLGPLILEQVKLRNLLDQKRAKTNQLQRLETDPAKNQSRIKEIQGQLDQLSLEIKAQKQQVRAVEAEVGNKSREIQEEYQNKKVKIENQNKTIEDLKQRRNSLQSDFQMKITDLHQNIKPVDKHFYDQVNAARDKYNTAVETLKLKKKELDSAIQHYNPNIPESVDRLKQANDEYDSQLTVVKQAKFNADSAEWAILSVINREKLYEHKTEEVSYQQAVAQVHDQYVGHIVEQISHIQEGEPIEFTLVELKEEKIQALDALKSPSSEPVYFATLAQTNPPYVLVEMAAFVPVNPLLPAEFSKMQAAETTTPQEISSSGNEKGAIKSQTSVQYTGQTSSIHQTAMPSEQAAVMAKDQEIPVKFDPGKTPISNVETETPASIKNDFNPQSGEQPPERLSNDFKGIKKPSETEGFKYPEAQRQMAKSVLPTEKEIVLTEAEKQIGATTVFETAFQKATATHETLFAAITGNKVEDMHKIKLDLVQNLQKIEIERKNTLEQIKDINAKIKTISDQLREPEYLPEAEVRASAQLVMESHQESLSQLKLNLQRIDIENRILKMDLAVIEKYGKTAANDAASLVNAGNESIMLQEEEQPLITEESQMALRNELEKISAEIEMAKATLLAEAAKGTLYPAMQPLPGQTSELTYKPEPLITAPGKSTGDQSGGQGGGSQQGQGEDQRRKEEAKKAETKEKEEESSEKG